MKRELSCVVRQIPLFEEIMWSGKEKWCCLVYLDNYKNNSAAEERLQYFVYKELAHVQWAKGELHYDSTEKLNLNFEIKAVNSFINTPSVTTDKNPRILL
jgi:hypothetical protein